MPIVSIDALAVPVDQRAGHQVEGEPRERERGDQDADVVVAHAEALGEQRQDGGDDAEPHHRHEDRRQDHLHPPVADDLPHAAAPCAAASRHYGRPRPRMASAARACYGSVHGGGRHGRECSGGRRRPGRRGAERGRPARRRRSCHPVGDRAPVRGPALSSLRGRPGCGDRLARRHHRVRRSRSRPPRLVRRRRRVRPPARGGRRRPRVRGLPHAPSVHRLARRRVRGAPVRRDVPRRAGRGRRHLPQPAAAGGGLGRAGARLLRAARRGDARAAGRRRSS